MVDRGPPRRARADVVLMLSLVVLLLLQAPRALAARLAAPGEQQAQPAAAAAETTTPPSSRGDDFDFFFLVRQYPPTFCNDHRCSHSPPREFTFTIHGLWPQRADGSWPEFCGGPDGGAGGLSLWRLRSLLPRLARQWPSWTASNRQFWQHEWARHGACAAAALSGGGEGSSAPPLEPGRGQRAFFGAVLDLHEKYPVEKALSAAGIAPSDDKTYAAAEVVAAVREAHGVRPHVTCDFHGNLAEVWHCVAKDGRVAVDCGPEQGGGGGGYRAAVEEAEERRKRRHAAAAGAFSSPPPPSNTYCRTVALPPPRPRRAAEAVVEEAPLLALAAAVLACALAAVRGGCAWGPRGDGRGEAAGRPLLSAAF